MNEFIPVQMGKTVDFSINGCNDTAEFDAGDVSMTSEGKMLSIDVTLRNVCPGKRVALAAVLSELDAADAEQRRGMRCITVAAQSGASPADVLVRGIRFVLPADISLSSGTCRRLRVRFYSHYIDSDVTCLDLSL